MKRTSGEGNVERPPAPRNPYVITMIAAHPRTHKMHDRRRARGGSHDKRKRCFDGWDD